MACILFVFFFLGNKKKTKVRVALRTFFFVAVVTFFVVNREVVATAMCACARAREKAKAKASKDVFTRGLREDVECVCCCVFSKNDEKG